jgi:hypothetical protein
MLAFRSVQQSNHFGGEEFLYELETGPAGGRQTIGLLNQTSRPPVEAIRIQGTRVAGGPAWASRSVIGPSLQP